MKIPAALMEALRLLLGLTLEELKELLQMKFFSPN